MILRRILAGVALLCAIIGAMPVHAQTGSAKTPAQLNAEINALFYNNAIGAISPFDLRQVTLDQVASSFNYQALCSTSGAFPIYNATAAAWVCSTVGGSGSVAVLSGSLGATVTDPTLTVPLLGFEQGALTEYFGVSGYVTNDNFGTTTGTSGLIGQVENLKGGVTAGVWGGIKDSIGSENYGQVGILEVNHAGGAGAAGGFFIRPNASNSIAPNATPYSGQDGLNIVNELVLATTGVGNAAIGLYINSLCYPSSSVTTTCPAGGSSDNTFTIGANIASARDEGLRIGSSSTNGYIPTKPITVYSTAASLLWYLDNLGNTYSNAFYIDQPAGPTNYKALSYDGSCTELSDAGGTSPNDISLCSGAATNYYNNTSHVFRSRGAAATLATLASGSFTLGNGSGAQEINFYPGSSSNEGLIFQNSSAATIGSILDNSTTAALTINVNASNPAVSFAYSSGNATFGSTTAASSTTTAAAVFDGGIGVAGSGYFGAAFGYGAGVGAGGAVTQATSRTTGVTINTPTGAITLFSAAGSTTPATFTVTNSSVAATDVIKVVQKSGANLYEIFVTDVTAGAFNITQFTTGGTTSEAPVFNFTVIKGAAT
jgi:hypothetical protein